MPDYQFFFLLQKALELCHELKSLTSSFLSIKEKRDAEALQILRAMQESSIQALVMEVRSVQLEEAGLALEALDSSRRALLSHYSFNMQLAGLPSARLVVTDTDFSKVPIAIPPLVGKEVVMTKDEQNDIKESREAKETQS